MPPLREAYSRATIAGLMYMVLVRMSRTGSKWKKPAFFTTIDMARMIRTSYGGQARLPKEALESENDTLNRSIREICTNLYIASAGEPVNGIKPMPGGPYISRDERSAHYLYKPTELLLKMDQHTFSSLFGRSTRSFRKFLLDTQGGGGLWQ